MKMDRGSDPKLCRLLPLVAILLVCSSFILGSAAETAGTDGQFNGLLVQHPAPILTPGAWKVIFSTEQISGIQQLTSKLRINVEKGTIKSVEIKNSSGVKIVDQELASWIQTKWHFRTNITGDFTLPVGVPLPAIVNVWGPQRSLHTIELRVAVDHGVIKNVYLLQSSGERLTDLLAEMWIKQHWLFTKDQSGDFQMPVYLRAHLR